MTSNIVRTGQLKLKVSPQPWIFPVRHFHKSPQGVVFPLHPTNQRSPGRNFVQRKVNETWSICISLSVLLPVFSKLPVHNVKKEVIMHGEWTSLDELGNIWRSPKTLEEGAQNCFRPWFVVKDAPENQCIVAVFSVGAVFVRFKVAHNRPERWEKVPEAVTTVPCVWSNVHYCQSGRSLTFAPNGMPNSLLCCSFSRHHF